MSYQEAVKRTMPKKLSEREKLSMLCMGLSGETGEVVDHVKKHLFQGHALDRQKVIDEAGDVLWYLANLLNIVGTTLEEVQEHNIKKLYGRYPEGFSAERSINRGEK